MADRQDIDALLIDALYGELDGDERARLEAHLASHPQDRSALDGLRATRELLRQADLPATLGAVEPSPAISAKLLQEAARRAPAAAGGGGLWAFLAGFFRPFAASPALSAATALALIGGTAGVLYSRGAFRADQPTVASNAESREASAPSAAGAAPASGFAAGSGAPAADRSLDQYRVGLDEQAAPTGVAAVPPAPAPSPAEGVGWGDDAVTRERAGDEGAAPGFAAQDKPKPSKRPATMTASMGMGGGGGAAAGAKADLTRGSGYLELSAKDAPAVLGLDGDAIAREDEAESEAGPQKKVAQRGATGGAAPGEGRVADPAPAAPPPPPAATTAPEAPARDQRKVGSTYDPAAAAALDAWARDQHARMVKLVNAGKCTDAGAVGAEIARKAPDYYQANVANDRAVRQCRSYVDRARRTKNEDAKSKAAAPRSPAPQQDSLESVK